MHRSSRGRGVENFLGEVGIFEDYFAPGVNRDTLEDRALVVLQLGVDVWDDAVVDWVRAVEFVRYLLNLHSGANLRDEHNVLVDVAGARGRAIG